MKFNTPINLSLFQGTLKPLQARAEGRLPIKNICQLKWSAMAINTFNIIRKGK